jgi:proteasome lid subunit RPN8/RPN11
LFKTLIAVLALLLPSVMAAAQTGLPPELAKLLNVNDPTDWHRFATKKEAVLYAAARLVKCSTHYECAGTIAKDSDGRFVAVPVWTNYQSDHVEIHSRVPVGFSVVAMIHSHPCLPGYETGFYSPQDLMASILVRTPSYMVDLCTGDVHQFLPGTDRPDDVQPEGEQIYMSAGTIIGNVGAHDDSKANEGA